MLKEDIAIGGQARGIKTTGYAPKRFRNGSSISTLLSFSPFLRR